MSDAPIIITGCPRSGTTLLAAALDAHPSIAVTFERAVAILNEVEHHPAGWARYELQAYATACGKTRAAEKATCYTTDGTLPDMGCLRKHLPDAIVLHVARDPFDTVASMMAVPSWGGKEGAAYCAQYWGESVRQAAIWPAAQRLDIRYEALVADFQGTVTAALVFCGLDWSDACNSYSKSKLVSAAKAYTGEPTITPADWAAMHANLEQPVNAQSVGRGLQLSPEHRAAALPFVSLYAAKWGY